MYGCEIMVLEDSQKIGFAIEATEETDPITAEGSLYWKFGARTTKFNDLHPIEEHLWKPIYHGGTRMPQDFELISQPLNNIIAFYPTTTVADYLILGNCSTAATNIHTISNIDSGSLPTFTVRSEMSGGTVATYTSAVGCKATALTGQLICNEGFGFLSNSLAYNGIKTQTATRNDSTTGPYYQTSDGVMTAANQLKNRYHRNDGTFAFSIAGNDVKTSLAMFTYQIINTQNMSAESGQSETEWIDEGMYQVLVSGSLFRGNTDADTAYDSLIAETKTDDIILTIYNGSTNYATRTFSNIVWDKVSAPYASGESDRFWTFNGQCHNYDVSSKDGITDGVGDKVFYGE